MQFNLNRNQILVLGLIFLVNFLFKLIDIASPSLWYDEIISVQDTLLDFGHIKHEAEWDKNPPFYHYVLWIWSNFFGISELAVRSMSAFFSSLTAVLIYTFSLKLSNKLVAISSTLIFTFHPTLFYYAQEARCYSLLLFLVTINLMVIYSLINQPNIPKALLLGVLNFLIFYTHYIAGLILLCQFIYLLIVFKEKFYYFLLIYLTPILLVLLRFTKKQYKVIFFSGNMSKEKSNVPLSYLGNLFESINTLYISQLILFAIVLSLTYFLIKKNRINNGDKTLNHFKLFIILTPIFCIVLLYLLGKVTNVFDGRYLLFTTPYIILSLFIYLENKVAIYVLLITTLLFSATKFEFNKSKGMDYKFCSLLTKRIQEKEKVNILIQTHDVLTLYAYYYDINLFRSKKVKSREFLKERNIYYIENVDDLKSVKFDNNNPILFFQTYQKTSDDELIKDYFKGLNYINYSTNQIKGVKFSYLKKI